MRRMIFAPQFPTPQRYSSWWIEKLAEEFQKYYDEVIVLGKKFIKTQSLQNADAEMFSPVDRAIEFELIQMMDYLDLELQKNDTLFHADLSFPGLFHNILFHKKPTKCFAYSHAGPMNPHDYFSNHATSKFLNEMSVCSLYNKIFVGSYHQKRMMNDLSNAIVVRLPDPYVIKPQNVIERTNNVISVCRPCIQKVTFEIENYVSKMIGPIIRKQTIGWTEYSKFLSSSKVLLISSKADTFNYTILDAVKCGCIPIAPNNICFPEILPSDYLYSSKEEAVEIIQKILNGKLGIPEILCQEQIDNFYERIVEIMEA